MQVIIVCNSKFKQLEINKQLMTFKTFFHYISYLQYPLMFIGLYFAFRPYFLGFDQLKENPDLIFKNLNSVLILSVD